MKKGKIVKKETKQNGLPKFSNVIRYIKFAGWCNYLVYSIGILLWIALGIFFQYWSAIWVTDHYPGTAYGTISFIVLVSIILIGFVLSLFYAIGVRNAANSVYKDLIYSILRRPMSFFDTTSVGTVINRTVQDREAIDFQLAYFGQYIYFALLQLFSILVLVGISSVLMFFVFLGGILYFFTTVGGFMLLVNDFRKLTQISKGPVASNMIECVSGISSLQAYNAIGTQMNKFERNASKLNVSLLHEMLSNNYIFWKGEIISTMLFLLTALCIACVKVFEIEFLLNVQTLSLALTAILQLSSWMSYNLYSLTMAINGFTSIERMFHWIDNKNTEDEFVKPNDPNQNAENSASGANN
jgi:ABC-type multidrug transport system fused ATPase/permease subunit